MMTEQPAIRELVAVFNSRLALENAIEDLQSHGFDRSQISLLASRATVEQQLERPLADVHAVKDDPDTPRRAPLDRSDVGNVMGVAVGAVGSFFAKRFSNRVAADFQEQIDRGGILVWVTLRDREQEPAARGVLARHATGEVCAHSNAVKFRSDQRPSQCIISF